MSLILRIEEELATARRDRNAERRDALSLILSNLRSAEKELQRQLNDQEELQVLQRERKKRWRRRRRSAAVGARSGPRARSASSR